MCAFHSAILSAVPSLFRCSRCGEPKPREAFANRSTHSTGRSNYCRPCALEYHREWRQTTEGHSHFAGAVAKYRRHYHDRHLARRAARRAIKRGDLVPGPCEVGEGCDGPIEAHHDDYSQQLVVRWFCRRHHRALDRHKVGRPRRLTT